MKKTFVAVLLGAFMALGASTASAEKMILKFGHVGKPGSLFEASVNEFVKNANARLGDRAEVQAFGSSQLGKDKELLQKLKLGQITFSLPSSVMSSVADEFGVFEMPYIVQSRDHMRAIQAELGESVFNAAAESKGDLEGIKLRTPKGEWRVKMFRLYGANPTPMAFSDVFTALKTSVIDGQENPYAQIWSAKFQEVQKYLSITGHVYTPAYVLVSAKNFAKLPEDIQSDLMAAAAESQEAVYAMAAQLETDLLDNLREAGITINEADKGAFIEASKPVYEEFSSSVEGGAELIEQVQALAK